MEIQINRVNTIIAVSGFVGLLNGLQRYLLPIALISYGWDLRSYGIIYVVQAFTVSIPLILGGMSTDLKGRKSTVILSFGTFSIGVGIFAFVIAQDSLLTLVIAQVITTVSFGVSRMALSIQLADETIQGDERTRALGLQAGLRNFLAFLGPLSFGFLFENYSLSIYVFNDFEVGFALLAVLGVLGMSLSAFLPSTDGALIIENSKVKISDIPLEDRPIQYAFGIEEIVLGFTSGLIVPYINFYILTEFAPSDWEWGLITALGNVGVAAGSILASRKAEQFGKGKTVLLFNVIVPILAYGLAIGPNLTIVSAFYVGRITVANLSHPVWHSWYFAHTSENLRGRSLSVIRVSRRLSRAVGTAAGPVAYSLLGSMVFPLGAVFYPLAMAIPFIVEQRGRDDIIQAED